MPTFFFYVTIQTLSSMAKSLQTEPNRADSDLSSRASCSCPCGSATAQSHLLSSSAPLLALCITVPARVRVATLEAAMEAAATVRAPAKAGRSC